MRSLAPVDPLVQNDGRDCIPADLQQSTSLAAFHQLRLSLKAFCLPVCQSVSFCLCVYLPTCLPVSLCVCLSEKSLV